MDSKMASAKEEQDSKMPATLNNKAKVARVPRSARTSGSRWQDSRDAASTPTRGNLARSGSGTDITNASTGVAALRRSFTAGSTPNRQQTTLKKFPSSAASGSGATVTSPFPRPLSARVARSASTDGAPISTASTASGVVDRDKALKDQEVQRRRQMIAASNVASANSFQAKAMASRPTYNSGSAKDREREARANLTLKPPIASSSSGNNLKDPPNANANGLGLPRNPVTKPSPRNIINSINSNIQQNSTTNTPSNNNNNTADNRIPRANLKAPPNYSRPASNNSSPSQNQEKDGGVQNYLSHYNSIRNQHPTHALVNGHHNNAPRNRNAYRSKSMDLSSSHRMMMMEDESNQHNNHYNNNHVARRPMTMGDMSSSNQTIGNSTSSAPASSKLQIQQESRRLRLRAMDSSNNNNPNVAAMPARRSSSLDDDENDNISDSSRHSAGQLQEEDANLPVFMRPGAFSVTGDEATKRDRFVAEELARQQQDLKSMPPPPPSYSSRTAEQSTSSSSLPPPPPDHDSSPNNNLRRHFQRKLSQEEINISIAQAVVVPDMDDDVFSVDMDGSVADHQLLAWTEKELELQEREARVARDEARLERWEAALMEREQKLKEWQDELTRQNGGVGAAAVVLPPLENFRSTTGRLSDASEAPLAIIVAEEVKIESTTSTRRSNDYNNDQDLKPPALRSSKSMDGSIKPSRGISKSFGNMLNSSQRKLGSLGKQMSKSRVLERQESLKRGSLETSEKQRGGLLQRQSSEKRGGLLQRQSSEKRGTLERQGSLLGRVLGRQDSEKRVGKLERQGSLLGRALGRQDSEKRALGGKRQDSERPVGGERRDSERPGALERQNSQKRTLVRQNSLSNRKERSLVRQISQKKSLLKPAEETEPTENLLDSKPPAKSSNNNNLLSSMDVPPPPPPTKATKSSTFEPTKKKPARQNSKKKPPGRQNSKKKTVTRSRSKEADLNNAQKLTPEAQRQLLGRQLSQKVISRPGNKEDQAARTARLPQLRRQQSLKQFGAAEKPDFNWKKAGKSLRKFRHSFEKDSSHHSKRSDGSLLDDMSDEEELSADMSVNTAPMSMLRQKSPTTLTADDVTVSPNQQPSKNPPVLMVDTSSRGDNNDDEDNDDDDSLDGTNDERQRFSNSAANDSPPALTAAVAVKNKTSPSNPPAPQRPPPQRPSHPAASAGISAVAAGPPVGRLRPTQIQRHQSAGDGGKNNNWQRRHSYTLTGLNKAPSMASLSIPNLPQQQSAGGGPVGEGPMRFAPSPNEPSLEAEMSMLDEKDKQAYKTLQQRWNNRQTAIAVSNPKKAFDLPACWHFRFLYFTARQSNARRDDTFTPERAWAAEKKLKKRFVVLNIFNVRKQLQTKTLFPCPGLRTADNLAMVYMRASRYVPNETPIKTIVDNLVYVINTMTNNSHYAQKEGIGFLACMDSWKMKNWDMKYCYAFMMTLQGFMVPVKVQLFLIVNPPSWFGGVWAMMRGMLSPAFRKRVKIIPESKLDKYLAKGYQQYLPDEMKSGRAKTDTIVQDFITYRLSVEKDLRRQLKRLHKGDGETDMMSMSHRDMMSISHSLYRQRNQDQDDDHQRRNRLSDSVRQSGSTRKLNLAALDGDDDVSVSSDLDDDMSFSNMSMSNMSMSRSSGSGGSKKYSWRGRSRGSPDDDDYNDDDDASIHCEFQNVELNLQGDGGGGGRKRPPRRTNSGGSVMSLSELSISSDASSVYSAR